MLNFHRECWNPVKKHSKALVFFAVSKQIPIVYSADRGRAEMTSFVFSSSLAAVCLSSVRDTNNQSLQCFLYISFH